jgi:hypothetical protein
MIPAGYLGVAEANGVIRGRELAVARLPLMKAQVRNVYARLEEVGFESSPPIGCLGSAG